MKQFNAKLVGAICGMSECIAFDFDGTLANYPAGIIPNYESSIHSLLYANASLPIVNMAKAFRLDGYSLAIVTGRPITQEAMIRNWMMSLGLPAEVRCRPAEVGIQSITQAEWKAKVLLQIQPLLFVGDNPRIDEIAARISRTPYVDAGRYIQTILADRNLAKALEVNLQTWGS